MLDADQIAAIRARLAKATAGPWAWESIAEKSNEARGRRTVPVLRITDRIREPVLSCAAGWLAGSRALHV